MTEIDPISRIRSFLRRYLRFRGRSGVRAWGFGLLEFAFGLWIVYAFVAPVICR